MYIPPEEGFRPFLSRRGGKLLVSFPKYKGWQSRSAREWNQ
jgi:hypothetical protein